MIVIGDSPLVRREFAYCGRFVSRGPAPAGTPCALLTLSEPSLTIREVFLSFGPHPHHEPARCRVAAIDLHIARVWPQGGTRDHRGRQWGGRRAAAYSRWVSAADRGAGSLRRAGACRVSWLCADAGVQL